MPDTPNGPATCLTAETRLRHDYTLESLNRLVHFAARRALWHRGMEFSERFETTWSAMAECLYTSDEPPSVSELIQAGLNAVRDDAESHSRFLGHNTDDRYAGTRPRFEAYWRHVAQPAHSMEDAIIDRLALAQIWPRLRPIHREALAALATHGDYTQAAHALDKSYGNFKSLISSARREFLALWHEGETPSRPWVRDRRAVKGTDMHTLTYFLRNRRLRRNRKNQAHESAASGEHTSSQA
jgi:hypothetical protein